MSPDGQDFQILAATDNVVKNEKNESTQFHNDNSAHISDQEQLVPPVVGRKYPTVSSAALNLGDGNISIDQGCLFDGCPSPETIPT